MNNNEVVTMAEFMAMTPESIKLVPAKYESVLRISLKHISGTNEEQRDHLNTLRTALGYPIKNTILK